MTDLTETIRDRVYVALAKALGDEEAAQAVPPGDLILVGTFGGHPVHLEFGIEVLLTLERPDHTLVPLDVTEGPPPASAGVAFRRAYEVAAEAVERRFLVGDGEGA